MTLKKIATSVGVVLSAIACSAYADVNSQLASLQAQVNQLQSQVNAGGTSNNMMAGVVGLNSGLSWQMMSNESGVGKEMNLLQARQAGNMSTLTFGGEFEGDAIYQSAQANGAFTNPTIAAYAGSAQNSTRLALTNARLATTANIGSWITGYIQVGQFNIGNNYYDPTTNGNQSSSFAAQDAYVVLGDLSQMPVYGFAGKKDIDFGSFQSVNMYSSPLNRVLFEATGDTAGIGYDGNGLNLNASLINGGNQTTAAGGSVAGLTNFVQGQNLSTSSGSNFNNFAVNTSYGMTTGSVAWNVGAGYLNGSQFATTTGGTDGAWDLNGKVSVAGFDLLAEYTGTTSSTNVTTNSSIASAWDVGADYNFPIMGYKSVVSADYSGYYLGSGNAASGSQYVAGFRVQPINNVWTGIEYAYNNGGVNGLTDVNANGLVPAGTVGNNNTVLLDITAMF